MDRRDPGRTPHGETAYSPNSLLRALTSNPLDLGRLREDEPRSDEVRHADTPLTRAVTFLLAVALGMLVVISVTTLRANATEEDSPRAELQSQVREAQARAAELETARQQKEEELGALQQQVLPDSPGSGQDQADGAAGPVALSGPGLLLTLDDSAPLPPAPGEEEGVVNRVSDHDLQIAVNCLWAGGAEAIAINGTRLTATSAIRTAGSAILVDFQPLSPPYTISALGDPQALSDAVESSADGAYLRDISTRFGIRIADETAEDLTIQPRSVRSLREVRINPEDPAAEDVRAPTTKEDS